MDAGKIGGDGGAVGEHDLSDLERERVAPYVTDTSGPVFALTNLPEVVKGALFARYSRSPKSLRRLLLDEFLTADERDGRGRAGRRGRGARRGALRARARGVRRRLGGPARRRPRGGGGRVQPAHQGAPVGPPGELPRAVDALHPLLRSPRRAVPVPPSRRGDGAPRARPRLRGDARRSLRGLRRAPAAAGRARGGPGAGRSGGARRRPRPGDPGRGPRPAARPAAGGHDGQRGHLRVRPGLRGDAHPDGRAPAARGARVRRVPAARAAQGHPGVPDPRRPPGPGRGPRRLPARGRGHRGRAGRAACSCPRPTARTARRCAWWTSIRDGEARVLAQALWPASGRDLGEVRERVAALDPGRARGRARGVGRPARRPAPAPGAGARGHGLRVRGGLRLRRLPRPPAPPDAEPPGPAAHARPGLRGSRTRSPRPAPATPTRPCRSPAPTSTTGS